MKSLIDPVVTLAIDAGRKILEVYSSDFEVQSKEDDSPLTQADLASHQHTYYFGRVQVAGL
jgi:3'(2'), 5'-bisphosphate nucleotidase